MKKTRILPLILGTLALVTLAGCGGETYDAKVVFWTQAGKDIREALDKQIASFEKIILEKEGKKVKVEIGSYGDYNEVASNVIDGFKTGAVPQIAVAYQDSVADFMAKEPHAGDYVINLDNYANDPELGFAASDGCNPNGLGISDFIESYIEEGRSFVKSGLYTLPYMKSTETMIYNRGIVEQALADMGKQVGVETYMKKISWDDFMELVQYIGDHAATYGLTAEDSAVVGYDSDSNLFITQCYQRGIDYISLKDGKGSIDFNNAEAIKLVKELKEMHDKKLLLTKGSNGGNYSSNAFKDMKIVFCVGSTGGTGYSDPQASFASGVCKFPAYKDAGERAKYVSQGVSICMLNNPSLGKEENKTRTDYAWKFVKHILNTDNNLSMCLKSQGYMPVRHSCYEDPDYIDYLEEGKSTSKDADFLAKVANCVINDVAGQYYTYPVFPGTDFCRDQVGAVVTNALLGKGSAEDLLRTAYEETMKVVAQG